MEQFHAGETAVVRSEHKVDGVFVDPDTSITVSIYDPQNGAEITDGTMASSGEAGKHYYNYDIDTDSTYGVYRAIVKVVHVDRTTKERVEFEVGE